MQKDTGSTQPGTPQPHGQSRLHTADKSICRQLHVRVSWRHSSALPPFHTVAQALAAAAQGVAHHWQAAQRWAPCIALRVGIGAAPACPLRFLVAAATTPLATTLVLIPRGSDRNNHDTAHPPSMISLLQGHDSDDYDRAQHPTVHRDGLSPFRLSPCAVLALTSLPIGLIRTRDRSLGFGCLPSPPRHAPFFTAAPPPPDEVIRPIRAYDDPAPGMSFSTAILSNFLHCADALAWKSLPVCIDSPSSR